VQRFISSVLFLLTVAAALALGGLVVAAPWLTEFETDPPIWERIFRLFAEDSTVKRTALASAIGLIVTAWVFFRPRPAARSVVESKTSPS